MPSLKQSKQSGVLATTLFKCTRKFTNKWLHAELPPRLIERFTLTSVET